MLKEKAETKKLDRGRRERCVVVTHGWRSDVTDGPKGGWSSSSSST